MEPEPLWDAVAALFFCGAVALPDRTRVGRVVRLLKQHGATGGELRAAVERYRQAWPGIECTPESITKHFSRFRAAQTAPKAANAFRAALGV